MGEDQKINWELIISRLDTIVDSQDYLSGRLEKVEEKLSTFDRFTYELDSISKWKCKIEESVSPNQLAEIKCWKTKMDEVINPAQLGDKLKDIETLKTFRTQAIMVWLVIQALTGLAVFWKQ